MFIIITNCTIKLTYLMVYRISGFFFAYVTNFVKMGKICSIFNFGQSYLAILNVLVENNTGYNFCVFNIVALVKRKN